MNITTEFQTFAGTGLAPVAESTELIDEVRRGLLKHPTIAYAVDALRCRGLAPFRVHHDPA